MSAPPSLYQCVCIVAERHLVLSMASNVPAARRPACAALCGVQFRPRPSSLRTCRTVVLPRLPLIGGRPVTSLAGGVCQSRGHQAGVEVPYALPPSPGIFTVHISLLRPRPAQAANQKPHVAAGRACDTPCCTTLVMSQEYREHVKPPAFGTGRDG